MTKRFWLLLALCLASLAVVLTPVAAGKAPQKAKKHQAPIYLSSGYTCSGGATDTSGKTYGTFKAKLQRKGSMVDTEVRLKGADPTSTYGIYINQDPGGCPTTQVASLTTDKHGNGHVHLRVAHVAGATVAWTSAVDSSQVLRITAVKLSK